MQNCWGTLNGEAPARSAAPAGFVTSRLAELQVRTVGQDFKEGAVRLVRETGKPIGQVAWDLGINAGTLGNWGQYRPASARRQEWRAERG
jgi:transposase-like protein